jgi:cell division septation protein DedD
VVEATERLLPDEHGEPPLPQVYEKPPEKPADDKPASTPEGKYTLQVIRFSLEDRAVAVATVERLQKYGYAPVFIETHGGELAVCVGRFDDQKDKKALMWRDELRNLHSAYRHCDFVAVKSKG